MRLLDCFTSGVQTREYIIVNIAPHDRTRKSNIPRSAAWLLNTFSYGEIFIQGDRYTRIYLPIDSAYRLSGERGIYLKIELEDGWLGWGVIRKINSVTATKVSEKVEVRFPEDEQTQAPDSCLHEKSEKAFKYTWRDIYIFAKLRNINLSVGAINNRNKIYIEFKSVNSGITKRIIHPAELFTYLNNWYVAAFCELRNEIRLFKLNDILSYKILDEKYEEEVNLKIWSKN